MGEFQGLPMADDIVFELLHSEIINYAIEQTKEGLKDKKEVDLSVVEYIGFATGYKIMERLTREWPRFKDELDTMKFICTDFWTCIYKKQIDNLRTNHQGVYVLQDNAFRFLTNFSNGHQYLESAPRIFSTFYLSKPQSFLPVLRTCVDKLSTFIKLRRSGVQWLILYKAFLEIISMLHTHVG